MKFLSTAWLFPLAAVSWLALAWPGGRADAQTVNDGTTVSGSALFRSYCASCHGIGGRGDGPIAAHLRRSPADLTRLAAANNGIFPAERLVRIIDGRQVVRVHGDSDMPVWGDALSKSLSGSDDAIGIKIREIVRHLESMQQRRAE